MIEYLKTNAIHNCTVEGVEMGNEMGDDFHCTVMGFNNFNSYYAYLRGENTYASEWNDVIIDDPVNANDLYSSHDFIRIFKKNALFTTKIGLCAAPLPKTSGTIFKESRSLGCQEDWNAQLYAAYTDTIGIVEFGYPFSRRAFDAVIIHPYYNADNYNQIPTAQLNSEIYDGTMPTGFGYGCNATDGYKWTYTTTDEKLKGAFIGDDDGIGIRTIFRDMIKSGYNTAYNAYNAQLFFNTGLASGGKYLWTTEWNIKDDLQKDDDGVPYEEYEKKLLAVYTNGFSHALLLQEWWLKNLKLNYTSGFRKNFFTIATLQNYAGGAGKEMLNKTDRSEREELSLVEDIFVKRTPYFAMQLLSEISKNEWKYLPSTYTIVSNHVNIQPTTFIDAAKENIYVYYSNVNGAAQKYVLNTSTLPSLFPGYEAVDLGTVTIYSLQALQQYSTAGRSTLFDINKCYDGLTYGAEASHIWELKELSTPQTNVPSCEGSVDSSKCVVVPAYSIGYFKIPIFPYHPKIGEVENIIKMYPNPTSDNIYLTGIIEESNMEIYSIDAVRVFSEKIAGNEKINVQHLPSGIFSVIVNGKLIGHLVKQD